MFEDYPPFLISEIYLQNMGLLSYPHQGPLDRVNWVLPFWVDTRGQDALLGLPLFWGPVDGPANGAYFQTLSNMKLHINIGYNEDGDEDYKHMRFHLIL